MVNVDIFKNTARVAADVIADHAAEADLAQVLREEEDTLPMTEEGEDAQAHLQEETEDVTLAPAAEVPEEAETEAAAHQAEARRETLMEIIYKLKFKN